MEFDQELALLVAMWAVTIVGWILLAIVTMSLLANDDPGGLILYEKKKFITPDFAIVVALYASIVCLFSFGFSKFFWMVPGFPESAESSSRFGAAFTFGVFGAFVTFKLADKINRLHWSLIGKDEIISDVQKILPSIARADEAACVRINQMISEIEANVLRKHSREAEVASQRRIAFLQKLKAAL